VAKFISLIEVLPTTYHQLFFPDFGSVTSLSDTEILGPFVGSFTFRCKGKTEVQEGLLNRILQRQLKSKVP
jgi:hypothetical protein